MKGSSAPSSYCTKSEHVEGVFFFIQYRDLFLDVFFFLSFNRMKEFEGKMLPKILRREKKTLPLQHSPGLQARSAVAVLRS